jgi:hypothetical protein
LAINGEVFVLGGSCAGLIDRQAGLYAVTRRLSVAIGDLAKLFFAGIGNGLAGREDDSDHSQFSLLNSQFFAGGRLLETTPAKN